MKVFRSSVHDIRFPARLLAPATATRRRGPIREFCADVKRSAASQLARHFPAFFMSQHMPAHCHVANHQTIKTVVKNLGEGINRRISGPASHTNSKVTQNAVQCPHSNNTPIRPSRNHAKIRASERAKATAATGIDSSKISFTVYSILASNARPVAAYTAFGEDL